MHKYVSCFQLIEDGMRTDAGRRCAGTGLRDLSTATFLRLSSVAILETELDGQLHVPQLLLQRSLGVRAEQSLKERGSHDRFSLGLPFAFVIDRCGLRLGIGTWL